MYLYPYKIFSIAKKVWDPKANQGKGKWIKYLISKDNYNKILGIYSCDKFNLKGAIQVTERITSSYVSVLLGEIKPGVYLNVLDLDDCKTYDGEDLEPETKELLKEFNDNEWEWSQSGNGIHIYILTRKKYKTSIVKDIVGCKSFEWYADKRFILAQDFDFENTDLVIGKHDKFLDNILKKCEEKKNEVKPSTANEVKSMFEGKIINDEEQLFNSLITKRTPVEDMFTLRGCGYKDSTLIEIIDTDPSTVDQSQHDAKLLRKLMYYTLSFESAYNMAKKTNYYKAKDNKHKKKFDDPSYIERTRQFIERM